MRNLLVGVVVAAVSPFTFGAVSNCPTATTGAVLVTGGNTTFNSPIAAASTTNNWTSLGAAGCSNVDFTFSNFATGTLQGTGTANNLLTANGIYFGETPAVGSQLGNNTNVVISTVQGNLTGTDAALNDGTNNWISNSSDQGKAVLDQFSFVLATSRTAPIGISPITVTINNPQVDTATHNGATGQITFDLCLNPTAANPGVITTAGACTMAGGTFSQQVLTLLGTAPDTLTLALFTGGAQRVDLTTMVMLDGQGNNTAGFASIGFGFDEIAPEPSTFVLLGGALAGLGLLRFRKKS